MGGASAAPLLVDCLSYLYSALSLVLSLTAHFPKKKQNNSLSFHLSLSFSPSLASSGSLVCSCVQGVVFTLRQSNSAVAVEGEKMEKICT